MKRVLVIEDNPDNLRLIKYFLENQQYEAIPAKNGEEGVRLFKEGVYSFVLLDILLPDIEGFDVAHRMREHETSERTPIIAFTSYAMKGDMEKVLAAGCDGYIEKPLNPERFISELESILNQSGKE